MKTKVIGIFTLILMVASACGPQKSLQSEFTSGSQAWIDAPLPGSNLPLAAVEIVAHATNPGGIASFEIDLNGQKMAATDPDPASFDQTLMYTHYSWIPAAPGSYLIEVKAFDKSNQPGPTAQVVVEVGGPTPTEILTPTPSPTPLLTPTPTATVAPLTFTPSINAYCRFGPDKNFDYKDLAMKGQHYLMDGRNRDGSWYRIMLTPNEGCWVPSGAGVPSGDISHLRELIDIPTLVPACASYTDKTSCQANSSCQWKLTIAGPGVCANK